nr:polysaccharide deacetylase family protein [Desulfobaculum xiamenense]
MTFEDQIPERSVLITIDDVGQNTYEVAFDVLKSFGFPATVFVCTDLLAERQGALDWNRIREMRDAGLSIQHRTKTLRNLTRRMTGETLEDYIVAVDRELTVASLAFRAELGEEPQWFAYPYGATNEMVIELLKKNGFRGAFTLGGGAVPFFADDYRMDRITVSGDYSLDQFVKLLDTGAAHPGGGGVIPSMQALFDPSGGDPYEAVSARFLELAKEREQAGDNMMALEYFRITGTLNRNAPGVRKSAIEVRDRVAADAVEHLVAARAARDGGNADEAVAEYLEALRHDPENAEALGELKDMMTLETGRAYEITQNDVLRRIAEREYGNSDVEILLSKINNISVAEILEPGERIVLPLLSAELLQVSEEAAKATPAVTVVHPEEPSGAGVAHAAVPVAAPVAEVPMADRIAPLVAMCKLQFANGNYETVASITDEILQMDPGHADAVEIQRASYYAMATDYYKQGSNVRAMRMLRNLPGSYKDTAARMADVQKALDDSAEPLYLQGVNAFINEDLEKAVESWELTLQANPWHKKAKQDLDKARKLLEAVRGL